MGGSSKKTVIVKEGYKAPMFEQADINIDNLGLMQTSAILDLMQTSAIVDAIQTNIGHL